MDNFYARSVFFVRDGEDSLAFNTQTLGFKLDWNSRYEGCASVFQVSLFASSSFSIRSTLTRKTAQDMAAYVDRGRAFGSAQFGHVSQPNLIFLPKRARHGPSLLDTGFGTGFVGIVGANPRKLGESREE
jgi:hypothetical protein